MAGRQGGGHEGALLPAVTHLDLAITSGDRCTCRSRVFTGRQSERQADRGEQHTHTRGSAVRRQASQTTGLGGMWLGALLHPHAPVLEPWNCADGPAVPHTLSEPYLAVQRGVEHGRVVAIQAELLGDV